MPLLLMQWIIVIHIRLETLKKLKIILFNAYFGDILGKKDYLLNINDLNAILIRFFMMKIIEERLLYVTY